MGRSDLPGEAVFSLHPDPDVARAEAERLFARVEEELRSLLSAPADIRHVGATAVPGCLTKGDLDVVVRVEADAFVEADRALSVRFPRNDGSKRTDSFSAFEDSGVVPHLGIQLTVVGGADDYFICLPTRCAAILCWSMPTTRSSCVSMGSRWTPIARRRARSFVMCSPVRTTERSLRSAQPR